jgi:hypothetical protein
VNERLKKERKRKGRLREKERGEERENKPKSMQGQSTNRAERANESD